MRPLFQISGIESGDLISLGGLGEAGRFLIARVVTSLSPSFNWLVGLR